jgi:hypothetical protein
VVHEPREVLVNWLAGYWGYEIAPKLGLGFEGHCMLVSGVVWSDGHELLGRGFGGNCHLVVV